MTQLPKNILAIDPGASGAIAASVFLTNNVAVPPRVVVYKMPHNETEIVQLLERIYKPECENIVVIERVGGYMPGNSGPAAATFSGHVGLLTGALLAFHYRFDPPLGVLPRRWQSVIEGKPQRPVTKGLSNDAKKRVLQSYKRDLKNSIKEYVQRLYPDIKVTLGTADALGIYYWYLKEGGLL